MHIVSRLFSYFTTTAQKYCFIWGREVSKGGIYVLHPEEASLLEGKDSVLRQILEKGKEKNQE